MSPARRASAKRRSASGERDALDQTRAVFMISIAAELAQMHPQTLRMYESRGLVNPQRSPKNTRLYSLDDVERLRRIQSMTEAGLNLAGVETVLELEAQIERMRSELGRMRKRTTELERQMLEEVERVRRSFRAELVPYGAYEPDQVLPAGPVDSARIPVKQADPKAGSTRSGRGRSG